MDRGPSTRDAALLAGLADLFRLPLSLPEQDLRTRALDLAEAVTGSRIGYLHFVNDDQDSIALATWSTATVQQCQVVNERHYPVAAAGIWADTLRHRRAQVHNDYPNADGRRGLPEGHAPVTRHLGVCVVEQRSVRVLLGVGNKAEPYDADDVRRLQRLADDTWLIVQRLRDHQRLHGEIVLLREYDGVARVGTWEWDTETHEMHLGPVTAACSPASPGCRRSCRTGGRWWPGSTRTTWRFSTARSGPRHRACAWTSTCSSTTRPHGPGSCG